MPSSSNQRQRRSAGRFLLGSAAVGSFWFVSCGDGGDSPTAPTRPPPPPPPPRATTLTVSPGQASLAALGDTTRLTAEVRDQNGRAMPGATVTWSSADETVATVDGSGLVSAVSNGGTSITATSGSASAQAGIAVAQAVATITLVPSSLTFDAVGDTARLSASVADANGHAVAGAEVTWSSADTSVAAVDSTGLAMAAGPGNTSITATSGSASAQAGIAVAQAVSTITLAPSSLTFDAVGDTATLSASVADANGHAVAGAEVTWSSADTSVAAVDSTGLATAAGPGNTSITATSGSVSAQAAVTVRQIPAEITITPSSLALTVADTASLAATVTDTNGAEVTDATVTWSSANASIAAVDSTGLVTAAGPGHTSITATSGSVSAQASVTVEAAPAAAITITPQSLSLPAGETDRLMATVTDTNGAEVTDATVTWSSADPSIATVDTAGVVTAVSLGGTEVTAAFDTVVASVEVRVIALSSDRDVLVHLYRTMGGDDWLDNTNWLTNAPLSDWAGVRTYGDGRVELLDLRRNNLTGRIPPSISRLDRLGSLTLNNNALHGPIPPEIGRLKWLRDLWLYSTDVSGTLPPEMGDMTGLRHLILSDTGIEGPLPSTFSGLTLDVFQFWNTRICVPSELGSWFERINDRTEGRPCVPVTADRDVLIKLYHATGGPNWKRSDAWLSEHGINTWRGVATNDEGRVTRLRLIDNNLTGSLPPELGDLAHLEELTLYRNKLAGRLPPELGTLTELRDLALSNNQFEGPIPATFGNLVHVDTLYLSRNNLSGPIPGELGNMTALRRMSLFDNRLSGPVPAELGNLKHLRDLWLSDNALSGPIPPTLADMTSLEVFAAARNQLSGPLPPELGRAPSLRRLQLNDNEIDGRIPPELGRLATLELLDLGRNRLDGPIPSELGDLRNLWLLSLFENELTGPIPPELGNLKELRRLLIAYNRLSGAIPPELGTLPGLEELILTDNRLTGGIPPELGALSSLAYLFVTANDLSGTVPPELGDLASLKHLEMARNPRLRGLLPRALLNLDLLASLAAFETGLCAQIDGEFQAWLSGLRALLNECDAGDVERLALEEFYAGTDGASWTRSDGWAGGGDPGSWYGVASAGGRVRSVELPDNNLSGPLPAEVANLTELERLDVGGNNLAGEFPGTLASLADLTGLRVNDNEEMEGVLPFRLTELTRLEALEYEGTGLCASPAMTFQNWLGRIGTVSGTTCGNPAEITLSLPVVYLTQAIQRPNGDVPLIANRDALLRVFLTSDESPAFFEPEVVATFTRGGGEVHRVAMRRDGDLLATAADESDLLHSFNAVITGDVIRPGLELVVEADPAGTVPAASGSRRRFPASGAATLNVVEVAPLELTVVPVVEAAEPDSSIYEWVDNVADDSPEVGLFRYSFPFSEFSAKTRETYVTSLDLTNPDHQWSLVLELEAAYAMEDATGYWYGAAASVNGYVRGRARLGGWVSMGKAWDTELAHEVGHNLDLLHAPCGGALGTDPGFPHQDGGIGAWGYDFRDGSVVSRERRRDIMGYCYELGWLSDYYYEKVIDYRARVEGDRTRGRIAAGEKSEMLVLWGGVVGGRLRLEPVFRMAAAPRLPEVDGPYRVEGTGADGDAEFSLSFTPGEDKYGDKYFFFTVPVEADWDGALERITLTGPEGAVTVDADDDRTLSVVTDRATGRIRAILRDWAGPLPAALGTPFGLDMATTRATGDVVGPPR